MHQMPQIIISMAKQKLNLSLERKYSYSTLERKLELELKDIITDLAFGDLPFDLNDGLEGGLNDGLNDELTYLCLGISND